MGPVFAQLGSVPGRDGRTHRPARCRAAYEHPTQDLLPRRGRPVPDHRVLSRRAGLERRLFRSGEILGQLWIREHSSVSRRFGGRQRVPRYAPAGHQRSPCMGESTQGRLLHPRLAGARRELCATAGRQTRSRAHRRGGALVRRVHGRAHRRHHHSAAGKPWAAELRRRTGGCGRAAVTSGRGLPGAHRSLLGRPSPAHAADVRLARFRTLRPAAGVAQRAFREGPAG